ncbi:MAG: Crp/Fnr family transcriptional regulator [Bacteroidales bacterium]|nr:Crp/Fnr family transcriptional regulator [Bacteroidales bacterium]
MDCVIPTFDCLNEDEIIAINKNSYEALYRKKDLITKQNSRINEVALIKSGLVKIFKEGRLNKNHIVRLSSRGELLGIIPLLADQSHNYSAIALDDCSIIYINAQVLLRILKNNGVFFTEIIKNVLNTDIATTDRLISLTHKQLPGRIADVLLYFSEEIYKNNSFTLPLSRQELAELAGTTKESFIRTLTEFKNDRIISIDSRNIIIESLQIVKTLSKLG